MKRGLALAFLVACSSGDERATTTSTSEQFDTVCGSGPTVKGIDVSYYQGTIDWTKVKADGVQFAFIRVSDGTGYQDPNFQTYWDKSRAAGIVHGAYQFFRPAEDPIAQADLLLSKIGTLAPDDLPPVIDVEATGNLGPAAVAAKVKQWVDHVAAATGKTPIIYTGYYFWRDSVGDPNMAADPLWHAQYTTAACPTIAPAWPTWAFWQYTSTGTINGISGGVDVDRFNGTYAQLMAMAGPTTPTPPCDPIGHDGGLVDDGDACFTAGGPLTYIRTVTATGEGGDLRWTHTTDAATEANFGQWNLTLAEAGTYAVEAYTTTSYAQSKQAKYIVHANGVDTESTIDQSAVDGWQPLGTFDFAAGDQQFIHLGDNTGEPGTANIQLVFDAVRLTRIPDTTMPPPGGDPGEPAPVEPSSPGGCNTGGGGGAGGGLALGLLAFVARRRR